MSKKWSKEEEFLLIEKYSTSTSQEIRELFNNRSEKSIFLKAAKLGLKKIDEIRSLHIANRNKTVGRDLTQDLLRNIALKYTTRAEFQLNDASAYVTSRKMGILDDICKHMIIKSYSRPQLILKSIIEDVLSSEVSYNDRKIISPLEIDVYVPKYKIAFEYNGKGWHKGKEENDSIKIEKCENKNIKLFILIENNRNYENDIKNQLIEIKSEIENICKIKISEKSIIESKVDYKKMIPNINMIKEICEKYNDFSKFKEENPKIYRILSKTKNLSNFTSHMKKKRNDDWDIEKAKNTISQYTNLSDLISEKSGLYQYCLKTDKKLLSHLKRKNVILAGE